MQERSLSNIRRSSINISKAKTQLEKTVKHKNQIISEFQKNMEKLKDKITKKTITEKIDEEEFNWSDFDYDEFDENN